MQCSNERPEDVIVSAGMTLQNYGLNIKKQDFMPSAKRSKVKYNIDYLTKRLKQKILENITKKTKIKPARRQYDT